MNLIQLKIYNKLPNLTMSKVFNIFFVHFIGGGFSGSAANAGAQSFNGNFFYV